VMEKTLPLQQMLLGKLDTCLQKTGYLPAEN
jgi:hypothetical protein